MMSQYPITFFPGSYDVILDESHYKELLTKQLSPPPACVSSIHSIKQNTCLHVLCYTMLTTKSLYMLHFKYL